MSGIFNGLINPISSWKDSTFIWKSSFFAGLLFSSSLTLYSGSPYAFFDRNLKQSLWTLGFSGLLVGLGTKLSNGCTSGHGVCGLPRFSLRSLAAVMTFMATGVITATLFPASQSITSSASSFEPRQYSNVFLGSSVAILLSNLAIVKGVSPSSSSISEILVSFGVGSIFGLGLLLSGMSRQSKVLSFLTLNSNWDPSLMFVMGGAVLGNLITFNLLIPQNKPPQNNTITKSFILGAALFGVGWGLSGVCPGPSMLALPYYFPTLMLSFIPMMAIGQYIASYIQ
eukprot:TRINITY_DN7070_c0_g1_i2.p1 TRINITY_DN7070_c0_g1~~TRINITY_DN7070_c0_g1_i2.p1  ORF type:complete len:284 (-),score=26.47 TRINITY_DN7070_c0_g1_i2:20-871(-)